MVMEVDVTMEMEEAEEAIRKKVMRLEIFRFAGIYRPWR
jgi:hypothetical protein